MKTLPEYALNASRAYQLMCEQAERGVCFDKDAAIDLYNTIDKRMGVLEELVNASLPQRPLNAGEEKRWTPPKIQFKKDGSPSAACVGWFDEVTYTAPDRLWYGSRDGKAYTLPWKGPIIDSLPMTIANQQALKDWALKLGWKPTIWNYKQNNVGPGKLRLARDDRGNLIKTSPKFHDKGRVCDNLLRLKDKFPLVEQIVEWMTLRHRRSVLWNEDSDTGWIAHGRLERDGRLPAASTGLTNTKRQKHTCVANVPRVTTPMGLEMRALFTASPGMVMVGCDAKGLEARIKGHYTFKFDEGSYAKKLLDPEYDEHAVNAALWGCERDDAKSPGYALQYNAQAAKFSETLGVSIKVGKKHYAAYWKLNWALRKAIEETEEEFERNFKKFITLVDGSKVVTRAKHSVFNAKCQGTGAKVMDMACILTENLLTERQLEAHRVIFYHDEMQYECKPEVAEAVGTAMCDSIRLAGEHFNLNVPLAGDYKVGNSWAETH